MQKLHTIVVNQQQLKTALILKTSLQVHKEKEEEEKKVEKHLSLQLISDLDQFWC